jgi:hypothetical protein
MLGASIFAQSNAPAISGVVTDTSKTPVIGVSIEVKNVDTGNVYKGGSGPGGVYAIQQAPPGKYELTASSFGFKNYVRKDIVIQAKRRRLTFPSAISFRSTLWAKTGTASERLS